MSGSKAITINGITVSSGDATQAVKDGIKIENGKLTMTVEPDQDSIYMVEFSVKDPGGLDAVGGSPVQSVSLTYLAGNTPPTEVSPPGSVTLDPVNATYDLNPHYTDAETPDALTYAIDSVTDMSGTAVPSGWLNIVDGVLKADNTAAVGGEYMINYTVTDPGLLSVAPMPSLNLTYIANTPPTEVSAPGTVTLDPANATYDLKPHYTDAETPDALTYAIDSVTDMSGTEVTDWNTWISIPGGVLTVNKDTGVGGEYMVNYTVTDPGGLSVGPMPSMNLTYIANTPPTEVSPPGTLTLNPVNVTYDLNTHYTDAETPDALTYAIDSVTDMSGTEVPGWNTWISIPGGVLTVNSGTAVAGEYMVNYTVTDPGLLSVAPVPSLNLTYIANTPPTEVSPPGTVTLTPCALTYDLKPHYTDAETPNALTYTIDSVTDMSGTEVTGWNTWISIPGGFLTVNKDAGVGGEYMINYTVTDPGSLSVAPVPSLQLIYDANPPTVSLEITGSPFAENEGTAIVTAILNEVAPDNVTVSLGFTGTAGVTDYTASANTIIIPKDSTTGFITLTGVDDDLVEGTETVIIDIASVTNACESTTASMVIAEIVDDITVRPTVTLGLSNPQFAENNGGTTIVTATLDMVSAQDVTVNLGFGGIAGFGTDYTASGITIVISAGSTTGTIKLTGVNDYLIEGNETVTVEIISVVNADELGEQLVTAVIVDDDQPGPGPGPDPWPSNYPPVLNDGTFVIEENSPIDINSPENMLVGKVQGSDPNGTSLIYTITDGNIGDAFKIDPNTGEIRVNNIHALNFEETPEFKLTIKATDPGGLSDTAIFTIRIADINEPPLFGTGNEFTIHEHSPEGTVIGTLDVSDPEGDGITFFIVDGNIGDAFTIDPVTGVITVKNPEALDFETHPVFALTIRATDDGDPALWGENIVYIRLSDVEERPPIYNDTEFTIPENSPDGTFVGQQIAHDPDGDNVTYSIIDGNINDAFVIDPVTGIITVNNAAMMDFETYPVFTLTVQATDDGSPNQSDTGIVIIKLTDVEPEEEVNHPPVLDDTVFTIPENSPEGLSVGTLTGTDPDNDNLTYSILDGNTDNAFAIDPVTGKITVNNTGILDYETTPVFTLTVQVKDDGNPNLADTAVVTIRLTDVEPEEEVNHSPVLNDAVFTIPENSPAGLSVGTLLGTDPDSDRLTYSIINGNTDNAFAIDPVTGKITVNNTGILDYETTPVFTLTVQVKDDGNPNLADTAIVTIRLTDVEPELNHPPVLDDTVFTIAENSPDGMSVGTLTGTDPDNDKLMYSIINGNTGNAFAIDPATGKITVNNSGILDYETLPVFTLTVQVKDDGNPNLTDTALVTIRLTDVEGINAVNDYAVTDEDHAIRISVLDNDTSEAGDTLGVVSVNTEGTLGTVTLNPDSTVSYNPAASAVLQGLAPGESMTDTFTYTVSDGKGNTDTATVTVTVNGVNDLPVLSGAGSQIISEGQTAKPFAGVTLTDPDGQDEIQTITIRMDNPDLGTFADLNGFTDLGNGVYTFTGTTDQAEDAMRGMVFKPAEVEKFSSSVTHFSISIVNHGQEVSGGTSAVTTYSSLAFVPAADEYWRWGYKNTPFAWGCRGNIWEHGYFRGIDLPPAAHSLMFESDTLGLYIDHGPSILDIDSYGVQDFRMLTQFGEFVNNGLPVFVLKDIQVPDFDFALPDQAEDLYELANRMLREAQAQVEAEAQTVPVTQ